MLLAFVQVAEERTCLVLSTSTTDVSFLCSGRGRSGRHRRKMRFGGTPSIDDECVRVSLLLVPVLKIVLYY